MSYEGYVNIFCGNGHLVESKDCYDHYEYTDLKCFCGSTVFLSESVDLTNGCVCNEMSGEEVCPAHSRILKNQIGTSKQNCVCNKGKIVVITNYKTNEKIEIDCPTCKGTSEIEVPVYDISSIRYDLTN